MIKSDTIAKLANALCKFQGEIDDVTKDSKGQKNDYASLGAILSMVRPILAKHGLSHTQLINSTNDIVGVSIETVLMHESGEYIGSTLFMPTEQLVTRDGRNITNQSQAIGSAISYARRYALASALGITQKDDDADSCDANPKPEFKRQEASRAPSPMVSQDQALELLEYLKEAGYTEDKVKAHYKVNSLLDMTIPMWNAAMGVMKKKIEEKKEAPSDNP